MSKWRSVLVGGGIALAVAGAAIWAGPAASGAGEARMAIDPASMNVENNGETFTVDVKASDVNNLGAFDFTIRFDNDLLEYVGLVDGGYLSSTARNQQCIRPAAGPNGESREQIANQYGALHYGCTTFGLIADNAGKQGPSGSGTLATLTFKPKAPGMADIQFVGLDNTYIIGSPSEPADAGFTGLSSVEQCSGNDCGEIGVEFLEDNAIIRILGDEEPVPTAPPATPTRVPRSSQPLTQATVDAALGRTPGAGRSGVIGSSGSGSSGASGSGSAGVSGSGSGRGSSSSGSGASGSGARGVDGAPIAGYGPQGDGGPSLPARAGAALVVAGVVAAAAGIGLRRRTL